MSRECGGGGQGLCLACNKCSGEHPQKTCSERKQLPASEKQVQVQEPEEQQLAMQETVGVVPVPRNLGGAGQKVGTGLSIQYSVLPLADPTGRLLPVTVPSICLFFSFFFFLELAHASSLVDTHLPHPITEDTET